MQSTHSKIAFPTFDSSREGQFGNSSLKWVQGTQYGLISTDCLRDRNSNTLRIGVESSFERTQKLSYLHQRVTFCSELLRGSQLCTFDLGVVWRLSNEHPNETMLAACSKFVRTLSAIFFAFDTRFMLDGNTGTPLSFLIFVVSLTAADCLLDCMHNAREETPIVRDTSAQRQASFRNKLNDCQAITLPTSKNRHAIRIKLACKIWIVALIVEVSKHPTIHNDSDSITRTLGVYRFDAFEC